MKKNNFCESGWYALIVFIFIVLALGWAGTNDFEEERSMHFAEGWESHISQCSGCDRCIGWGNE